MRTLAFYFEREPAAMSALAELSDAYHFQEGQIDSAPLVIDGQDGTILAMSAEAEQQPDIVELVSRHEGRLVADVPEEWTQPRLT